MWHEHFIQEGRAERARRIVMESRASGSCARAHRAGSIPGCARRPAFGLTSVKRLTILPRRSNDAWVRVRVGSRHRTFLRMIWGHAGKNEFQGRGRSHDLAASALNNNGEVRDDASIGRLGRP